MAELSNRSRFHVTVRNRDDLARHFPFTQMSAARACVRRCNSEPPCRPNSEPGMGAGLMMSGGG